MKRAYVEQKFNRSSLEVIGWANEIIDDYQGQGYDLTVRQLYYQMVSKDLIVNTQKSYKRLANIVSKGRNSGLIDWDAIVDRTRHLRENPHWTTPKSILRSAAQSYLEDRWQEQKYRLEVWIEKDALIGVIAPYCEEWDIPHFSARGYPSQSAMHEAGRDRLMQNDYHKQQTVILHLGDHDPSGLDMTRDIEDRLTMYSEWSEFEVRRIALNMEQVEQYGPPPNPAKITDPRAKAYIKKHGGESWELDALEPSVLVGLIDNEVNELIDFDQWEKTDRRIEKHKTTLAQVASNYEAIQGFLNIK